MKAATLDFGCDDVLNGLDDRDLLLSFDRVLFVLDFVFFALASSLIVSVFGGIEFLGRLKKYKKSTACASLALFS